MKRRISIQYSLVLLFALALFIVGSALLVGSNFNKITQLNLDNYLAIVEEDYRLGLSPQDLVDKYVDQNDYLRITIVDATGIVLADSLGQVAENHLSRPEILEPGTFHLRFSVTANKTMMYLADEMSDGNYVRIAIPQSSILPFLNDFIGLSMLVAAAIIAAAVIGVVRLVDLNMKPLRAIESSLQSVATHGYAETLPLDRDEEMNQIVLKINAINALIAENLVSLSHEKLKNDFILDHMGQGLVVLNQKGDVELVNRFVQALFQIDLTTSLDRNYLFFFRVRSVQHTIERALHEQRFATAFFEQDGKYYSVSADYLNRAWNQEPSVLLLFSDITSIKDIEVMKRDFFANASHELKSPLTSIMGASELISSGLTANSDQVQDLASRILQEAKRMNNLVLDMLSLSKYEDSLLKKGEHTVDLVLLMEDVRKRLETFASERNIVVTSELASAVLVGEYEHFYELVHNLVENAIKYGKTGGFVTLRLRSDAEAITIEVADNGIGIPKAEQSRVFERFYRVDKSRSQKVAGTGLGLSIVKHIAMLYEGEIHMQSEVGQGTTVTIRIPKY
jgi:two-component system, OmpR family, phosphate regulon sensor histidine kinase PhoR